MVGPRAGMGAGENRKVFAPAVTQTLIPQLSNLQPTAILAKLSQLPDKNRIKP
jgi:hypothetical protein